MRKLSSVRVDFAKNRIGNSSLKLLDTKSLRFLLEVTPCINKVALSQTDVI